MAFKIPDEVNAIDETVPLKEQRKQYLKNCNLTKQFFCKFDPETEHSIQFLPLADHKRVVPCCVPEPRSALILRRDELVAKLQHMEGRLAKFYDFVYVSDAGLTATPPTIILTVSEHTKFKKLQKELQGIVVIMQQKMDLCLKPLFTDGLTGIRELSLAVCEPIDPIVKEMETAFYPRMFGLEKIIAEGRAQADTKRIADSSFGWLRKAAEAVLKRVIELTKQALAVVRVALSFVYTYGMQGIKIIFRVVKGAASIVLQKVCKLNTDDKKLMFYTYMHDYIENIMSNGENQTYYITVRNVFEQLRGRAVSRWVTYLFESCKTIVNDLMAIIQKRITDFAARAVGEIRQVAVNELSDEKYDAIKVSLTSFLNSTGTNLTFLSQSECAKWLWIICVWVFDKILTLTKAACAFPSISQIAQFLGIDTETSTNLDAVRVEADAKEDQEQTHTSESGNLSLVSSEADKSFLEEKKATTMAKKAKEQVQKRKEENEIGNIPDLTLSKKPNITGLIGTTVEKWNLDINTDQVVNVMFKCFWYLSKNNFIPKIEIENNLQEYENLDISKIPQTVSANPTVPPYVRYSYCRAQDISAEDCEVLAKSKHPLYGHTEIQQRYESYITDAAQKYEEKEALLRAERIAKLQTETQIRENIMTAIAEARAKATTTREEVQPASVSKLAVSPSSISANPVLALPLAPLTLAVAKLPPTAKPPPAVIKKPAPPAVIQSLSPTITELLPPLITTATRKPPPAVIRKPPPPAVPTPTIAEPPLPIITTATRKPPPAVIRKPPPAVIRKPPPPKLPTPQE